MNRKDLANARQIRAVEDQSEPGGAITSEGTGCAYMGSTSVNWDLQQLSSMERFNAAIANRIKAGELQLQEGVGDAAWFRQNKSRDKLLSYGILARVGSNLFQVTINPSEAGSADRAKALLLPIAKSAAAKLR